MISKTPKTYFETENLGEKKMQLIILSMEVNEPKKE